MEKNFIWISVDDRLPASEGKYIVKDKDEAVLYVGRYNSVTRSFTLPGRPTPSPKKMTHWLEISDFSNDK
jgi:Protein of unknown function (DUF551)